MTDKELKAMVADLVITSKETTKSIQEIREAQKADREAQKADREAQKADREAQKVEIEAFREVQKETDRQIKQVNKQLGEIGNKWGTFAEGMAIESIKKILREQFNIPVIAQNVVKRLNGETIEIDAFGYENSTINTAVIVEIKSHLKETAIEQIEETIKNFPVFFPDHAGKKLFGIIACVSAPESLRNIIRKKGLYLAILHDDIFELCDFKNFTPTNFQSFP